MPQMPTPHLIIETLLPHLQIEHPKPTIYLGWGMGILADKLRGDYDVPDLANAYSKEVKVPNLNGIQKGKACADKNLDQLGSSLPT